MKTTILNADLKEEMGKIQDGWPGIEWRGNGTLLNRRNKKSGIGATFFWRFTARAYKPYNNEDLPGFSDR
jgi:hypothetical protein